MQNKDFIYKNMIRSLRMGAVPEEGFEELIVGRESEIRMFEKELEFVQEGGGSTKFLQGDYGSGKTFLASVIREKAWEKNFIVSWVELGRDNKFNKLENVYFKIIEGMRTRNYRKIPALEYILQDWLNQLEEGIRYKEDLNPLDPEEREKINRLIDNKIEQILQNVGAYNASFINAIRGYYHASKEQKNEVKTAAIGWLKGERNIPTHLKKGFNVKGSINKDNVLSFLNAIIKLIIEFKYAGLVVIIDETEIIANIARHDHRNEAYENLRKIVDSTMNHNLSNVFFLFTATEFFFTNEDRGVPSYQALAQRIQGSDSTTREKYRNLHSPIISLEGLNKEQLKELSYKVRNLHSRVYHWQAEKRMNDQYINDLVDQMADRFNMEIRTLPRIYLKILVEELDLLEQNSDYNGKLEKAVDKIKDLNQEEMGKSHAI